MASEGAGVESSWRDCVVSTNLGNYAMKHLFAAAAIAAIFVAAPAQAADKLECNDDGMMKVEMMMKDAMKMAEKKEASEMAMKSNEMAMAAKKDGNMEECAKQLNMAQETLMK
jgi:sugar phosphate permease